MSDEQDDILEELVGEFIAEAPQLLQETTNCLGALVADPEDEIILEALEGSFATLKQRAGFIDFTPLVELSGALEDLLKGAREAERPLGLSDLQLIEEGAALAEAAVGMLQSGERDACDTAVLVERVRAAAGQDTAGQGATPEALVADVGTGDGGPLEDEGWDDVEDDGWDDVEEEALDGAEGDAVPSPVPEPAGEAAEEGDVAAAPAAGAGMAAEEKPPYIVALEEELSAIEVDEGSISGDIADFVPDFIAESSEILEKLDEDLVRLEEAPEDLELLNEIFRGAHTLKGTSSFLGFAQMAAVTHKMENVLDLLRKGEMQLSQEIMDVVLQGVDQIKVLHADIVAEAIVERDIAAICTALVYIAETLGASVGSLEPKAAEAPVAAEGESEGSAAGEAEAVVEAEAPRPPPQKAAPAREADQVIRVNVERIDSIMNLAEELVLGRNRLLQLNSQLMAERSDDELVNRLNEATAQVGTLTGELQESVMMMRMVPVSRVFSRFPRMVRDLSRSLEKNIDLVVEDNDTEIDKSVADLIGDPLVHLIRNAIDHGVEMPQERRDAGKAERGTVLLSANHEGNHIVICIRDDGHGMDPDKLRAKAVEKGVINPAEAERMEDSEAYNLIFAPGFSTAQEVTDVSGRGVGMDVVRTNIMDLNGTIELDSELGSGTQVLIRLPLTLAIINGLQVSVEREIYILPLNSVVEALKVEEVEIEVLQGHKVIRARDKVLPLIDLKAVFDVPAGSENGGERYVVVTALAERRVGILVDGLLGQVEVVIKALSDSVGKADGIAGATILGDGRVRLILDVARLMEMGDAGTGLRPAPVGEPVAAGG